MDTDNLTAFICGGSQIHLFSGRTVAPDTTGSLKRILNLERILDVRLFDRSQKALILTDSGKELLRLPALFWGGEQSEVDSPKPWEQVRGELSIVCSHHIGLHRLPPVLQRFCHIYPEVKLNFTFAESEKSLRKLANQQTDFAFVTLDQSLISQYQVHLELPDPMHVVCANNHPLASKSTPTLKDLTHFDAILPDDRTYLST